HGGYRDAGARRKGRDELCVAVLRCNHRQSHYSTVNPEPVCSQITTPLSLTRHPADDLFALPETSGYPRLASHHTAIAISAAAGIVMTQATTILPATPQRTADTR